MTTLAVLVIFQPFVDLADAIIGFFAGHGRVQLGPGDRRAHLHRPADDPAAVADRDPLDAPDAAGRAGAEGGAGEVQGRPRAPAARDARPLPASTGSTRSPPASRSCSRSRSSSRSTRCCAASSFNEEVIASGSSQSFLFINSIIEKPEGAETVILIVLFIVTTVLTFLYTTATTQTATGPQRYIFLALPILFAPLIASQPAGLGALLDRDQHLEPRTAGRGAEDHADADAAEPRGAQGREDGQAAAPAAAEEEETSMRRRAGRASRRAAERVEVLLEEIVDALDLDGEIVVDEREDEIVGQGRGRRARPADRPPGQTIDAVQLLCYRVAFRGRGERKRVSVDAAGYRERRRETVERQAERAAERALESGKEIELEPMTPTERKIVHDRLKDRPGPRDLQRGRGARALRDRRPARRRLTRRRAPPPPRPRSSSCSPRDPASLSSVRDPERRLAGARRGLAQRARAGRLAASGSPTSAPAPDSPGWCSPRPCRRRRST